MALLTPLLFLIFCVLMVLYNDMDSCLYFVFHNESKGLKRRRRGCEKCAARQTTQVTR
jgi:hypothetical protein